MSRSRPKLDTSPIEYDDVVDSPALKGMVSFLEVPPGQLPQLDFTKPEQADRGVPQTESGTPDTTLPATSAPVEGMPLPAIRPCTPVAGAPETGTPLKESPVPGISYPPVLPRPLSRIRRALQAQDGHSFGEQALYDALWQYAHPHGPDTRIITIGYRRMAELARLTVNNCKANIQALIQKLAVEEVASFTHSQGRTYLVYSNAAILQRRRQAGLTHYIKSRGVAFVDPDTAEVLTNRIRDKSGAPFSAAPSSTSPVSAVPLSEAPPSAARSVGTPDSAIPPELIQGLREIVEFPDAEAAALLWRQCRRRAPDCTAEEILHFVRDKAAMLHSGRIQNAAGFLLAVIPKCFEVPGDADEQMREMRRQFQAILEDPASSEEDRRFVRHMLEGN